MSYSHTHNPSDKHIATGLPASDLNHYELCHKPQNNSTAWHQGGFMVREPDDQSHVLANVRCAQVYLNYILNPTDLPLEGAK